MKKIITNKHYNYFSFYSNNSIKNFSIVHNYHSPYILWSNNNHVILDDNLNEYNEYIQAFLNKRFTHKKEIEAKIKVLKDSDKILKDYHNTFYVQISYPLHNLIQFAYMRHIHNNKIIDSGYIITRFFEEYEKPMYDAALSKILINGRVQFIEDSEYFNKVRNEVNNLIGIFYNGDKLSDFEREIERAYLTCKLNKFNELQAKYMVNSKLKREECFLTFSERNKLNGHINFRMRHPQYFFNPCPIFEKINIDKMFYSLYEIRYNVLTTFQIYKKLQLKFYYRKSLMRSPHRTEFLSYYLYLQVFQYLESFEYYNEFYLSLNFKENFNMMVLHLWLIIQRLQKLETNNNNNESKFCRQIINNLTEKIQNYFLNNIDKFQFTHRESLKITNVRNFIFKLFDLFTWHFEIINKDNNIKNLRRMINEVIFQNNKQMNDKYLVKFAYYAAIHYEYLNTKSYCDIETSDFNFSINRIPINYYTYVMNEDSIEDTNFNSTISESNAIKNIKQYEANKMFLFNKIKMRKDTPIKSFIEISSCYGGNPYKDLNNFFEYDTNKGVRGRINRFLKNEMFYETSIALEKYNYEEEEKKKNLKGYIWEKTGVNEDENLGCGQIDKLKQRREKYLKSIQENTDSNSNFNSIDTSNNK